MRKSLLTLGLTLMLGGAAAITSLVNAQPARPPAQAARPEFQRIAPNPEQFAQRRAALCQNLHARAAGRLAELEVRLELTANQRAAFNRWRDLRLAAAQRRAQTCATAPVPPGRGGRGAANAQATPPSPVERMARQEQQLRQRLTDLGAERPALEALYNGLSPEQRQKLTPMAGGPRGGMGRGGRGNMRAMVMRDRMGGGPRGDILRRVPGGRGPGGPGMVPPPPPPQ